jgi:hypothetical protein
LNPSPRQRPGSRAFGRTLFHHAGREQDQEHWIAASARTAIPEISFQAINPNPMTTMIKRSLPLLFALLLAACSAGEEPRAAEFVPPADSSIDFGDLRVHYNALPTLGLSEAVAREYGVARDAGSAMVVIALRRIADGQELGADGEVSAEAYDLQGKRQHIDFSAVRTGDYTDHIGTFAISERDSYRFEVKVESGGRKETVKFQRNF